MDEQEGQEGIDVYNAVIHEEKAKNNVPPRQKLCVIKTSILRSCWVKDQNN